MQEWVVGGWDEPDLVHTVEVVSTRGKSWRPYVPSLELVRCGRTVKPALFFRVGTWDYPTWASSVELRGMSWNWVETKGDQPYVFVNLSIQFENPEGSPIGIDDGEIVVATPDVAALGHRLTCNAVFDPADPAHCQAIKVWATAPGPVMLFFVDKDLRSRTYVFYGVSDKVVARAKLAQAQEELRTLAPSPGALAANADAIEVLTKRGRW